MLQTPEREVIMEIDSSKLSAFESGTPVKEATESNLPPGDEFAPSVGIVFENDAWLSPLFEAMKTAGIPMQLNDNSPTLKRTRFGPRTTMLTI